jgi:hypothetical protein
MLVKDARGEAARDRDGRPVTRPLAEPQDEENGR